MMFFYQSIHLNLCESENGGFLKHHDCNSDPVQNACFLMIEGKSNTVYA